MLRMRVLQLLICIYTSAIFSGATITWQNPSGGDATFTLGEGVANDVVVFTLSATTTNGGGITAYSITAQTVGNTFDIDAGTSGIIRVNTPANLDYDGLTKIHVLHVRATDAAGSLSGTVTVSLQDINDNSPSFTVGLYSANVMSGTQEGEHVIDVSATDLDGTAANNIVTYIITGGNTGSAFTVGSTSGKITVSGSMTLDSSVLSAYLLVVEARDSGTVPNQRTGTTTVAIGVCSGVDDVRSTFVSIVTLTLIFVYKYL